MQVNEPILPSPVRLRVSRDGAYGEVNVTWGVTLLNASIDDLGNTAGVETIPHGNQSGSLFPIPLPPPPFLTPLLFLPPQSSNSTLLLPSPLPSPLSVFPASSPYPHLFTLPYFFPSLLPFHSSPPFFPRLQYC